MNFTDCNLKRYPKFHTGSYDSKSKQLVHFLIAILLLSSSSSSGFAQSASLPSVTDPELFITALKFLDSLEMQAQRSPKSDHTFLHESLRRELSVNESDLLMLLTEAAKFNAASMGDRLDRIQERQNSRAVTINNMKHNLSATGWSHFSAFVLGPFRQATVVVSSPANNNDAIKRSAQDVQ